MLDTSYKTTMVIKAHLKDLRLAELVAITKLEDTYYKAANYYAHLHDAFKGLGLNATCLEEQEHLDLIKEEILAAQELHLKLTEKLSFTPEEVHDLAYNNPESIQQTTLTISEENRQQLHIEENELTLNNSEQLPSDITITFTTQDKKFKKLYDNLTNVQKREIFGIDQSKIVIVQEKDKTYLRLPKRLVKSFLTATGPIEPTGDLYEKLCTDQSLKDHIPTLVDKFQTQGDQLPLRITKENVQYYMDNIIGTEYLLINEEYYGKLSYNKKLEIFGYDENSTGPFNLPSQHVNRFLRESNLPNPIDNLTLEQALRITAESISIVGTIAKAVRDFIAPSFRGANTLLATLVASGIIILSGTHVGLIAASALACLAAIPALIIQYRKANTRATEKQKQVAKNFLKLNKTKMKLSKLLDELYDEASYQKLVQLMQDSKIVPGRKRNHLLAENNNLTQQEKFRQIVMLLAETEFSNGSQLSITDTKLKALAKNLLSSPVDYAAAPSPDYLIKITPKDTKSTNYLFVTIAAVGIFALLLSVFGLTVPAIIGAALIAGVVGVGYYLILNKFAKDEQIRQQELIDLKQEVAVNKCTLKHYKKNMRAIKDDFIELKIKEQTTLQEKQPLISKANHLTSFGTFSIKNNNGMATADQLPTSTPDAPAPSYSAVE